MKQINYQSELLEAINGVGLVFVLKHSITCPISQAAYSEYEKFSNEHPEQNCYFLTVQDARPVSEYIAEHYHIKHESPQAIIFNNGDVNWHASHWKITNSALNSVLKDNA